MYSIGVSGAAAAEEISRKAFRFVEAWLPASALAAWAEALGYRWRERRWTPALTVWACALKHLQGGSARSLEDWWASLAERFSSGSPDGKDFCRARARLPEALWACALTRVGRGARDRAGLKAFGLWVSLVDGTTAQTPNTSENAACFGYSANRHRASRLPILRYVLLVCAGCAAVLDAALGGYHDSEQVLFAQLLGRLEAGVLLVADRGFCSFMALWVVRQRESHMLCRHHQTRRGRRIRRLGFQDELQCWSRMDVRFVRSPGWLPWLAEVDTDLWVRVLERQIVRNGYRTFTLRLCTTLLDPQEAPAKQLVELYLKRWRIEGVIRDLKADYAVKRLSGKSPDVARKEVWSGLLAYTLVSAIRGEGAHTSGIEAWSISARRSQHLLLRFIERAIEAAPGRIPRLLYVLRQAVAGALNDAQPRPPEPRLLVARPTRFQVLRISRANWKSWYRACLP
jgi:hypothetical protein